MRMFIRYMNSSIISADREFRIMGTVLNSLKTEDRSPIPTIFPKKNLFISAITVLSSFLPESYTTNSTSLPVS